MRRGLPGREWGVGWAAPWWSVTRGMERPVMGGETGGKASCLGLCRYAQWAYMRSWIWWNVDINDMATIFTVTSTRAPYSRDLKHKPSAEQGEARKVAKINPNSSDELYPWKKKALIIQRIVLVHPWLKS